jgi:hypothetical protein
MRTTIRIDDALLAEAKRLAARTGKSLTAVIEDALREVVARQQTAGQRTPVRLTIAGGGGVLPGVDLDDSAALVELMERTHDPD